MNADIALGERAQDRVNECVQHDIGIGMAGQGAVMGYAHAAQRNVVAFSEGVNIEAKSGAHIRERRMPEKLGAVEIIFRGELDVVHVAFEGGDLAARPFHKGGIIGKILAAGSLCKAVSLQAVDRTKRPAVFAPCVRSPGQLCSRRLPSHR